MKKTCSIVIRSFNEEKHIGRLLDGIVRQKTEADIELIVVDSGSTDATVSIARKFGATIVSIQPNEFSFGRALNRGCTAANGEFLLFASAHVYPLYTNWIEKMLHPFGNPSVALVYGRQTGNETTKYSEGRLLNKWFPKESNYDQKSPFCNNANTVIRRKLWEEQPYDESLTGLEDLDWASKIQKRGYLIAYEASASIVHVHEETASKIKNRYRREAIALKKIMPKQHLSFLDFVRLTTGNIINDGFHAMNEGLLLKNLVSIVQFRTMQFWGSYQGFRQEGQIDNQLKKRFYYPNEFKREPTREVEPGERIVYN